MDLKWLKYFHEVAKARSFTIASRNLRISQPAVSKMVGLFENELGVRLFAREGKSVQLTEAGHAFYERSQRIFDEQENLLKLRNLYLSECVGELSLGGSDNLLSYVFPPIVERYLSQRPHVDLKIFSGASPQLKRELLEKRLELACFFTPLTADEKKVLHAEVISQVEFVLVMRADLAKKHGVNATFSAATFNSHDLRYIGSRTTDYADNNPALKLHFELLGIEPRAYIQANNHEVIRRLCIAGIGYTVIPKYMVTDDIRNGTLMHIRTSKPMLSKVFLVRRKTAILSRPAREFIRELKSAIS